MLLVNLLSTGQKPETPLFFGGEASPPKNKGSNGFLDSCSVHSLI
jgi:hypothetical protein